MQDFQAAIREYQSHSESVALSTRADEELAEARRTKDYQDFARALFAYQEARCLWLGNDHAKAGEIETKLAYAETALEKEDFDLGVSLLDERHPEQAALRKRLVAAQRERQARQARFQALRRTALSLAALIFLLLTGGLLFIGRQYRLIDRQYQQIEQINKDLNKSINDLNVAKVKLEDEKRNVETANSELTKTQSRLLEQQRGAGGGQADGHLRGANGTARGAERGRRVLSGTDRRRRRADRQQRLSRRRAAARRLSRLAVVVLSALGMGPFEVAVRPAGR